MTDPDPTPAPQTAELHFMQVHHLAQWLLGALGAWLIASPVLFLAGGFAASPTVIATFLAGGVLSLAAAGFGLRRHRYLEGWLALALGLAVMGAPFLADFVAAKLEMWDAVLSGGAITAVALADFMEPAMPPG